MDENKRQEKIKQLIEQKIKTMDVVCIQECSYNLFEQIMNGKNNNKVYDPRLNLEKSSEDKPYRMNEKESMDGAAIFSNKYKLASIYDENIDECCVKYNKGKPICISYVKTEKLLILSLHLDKSLSVTPSASSSSLSIVEFVNKILQLSITLLKKTGNEVSSIIVAGDFNNHLTNNSQLSELSQNKFNNIFVTDTVLPTMTNEEIKYRQQIDYIIYITNADKPPYTVCTYNTLAHIYIKFNYDRQRNKKTENIITKLECYKKTLLSTLSAQIEPKTITNKETKHKVNVIPVEPQVIKGSTGRLITKEFCSTGFYNFLDAYETDNALSDHFMIQYNPALQYAYRFNRMSA